MFGLNVLGLAEVGAEIVKLCIGEALFFASASPGFPQPPDPGQNSSFHCPCRIAKRPEML